MPTIYQAKTEAHIQSVEELFWEYLQWANGELDRHYGFTADIEAMQAEAMQNLGKFMPPGGRIMLAEVDGAVAGIGCLKQLSPEIGEIKRMYVRPAFRRLGLGRLLLEKLLEEGAAIGYETIRLDSTRFMTAAHALYRSYGFREIDPYPESEIPPDMQQYWLFMEARLGE